MQADMFIVTGVIYQDTALLNLVIFQYRKITLFFNIKNWSSYIKNSPSAIRNQLLFRSS